jgi:hypothetical protein
VKRFPHQKLLIIIPLFLITWALFASGADAQVNRNFTYQGYLTDKATGNPVTASNMTMRFSLHDALTGGSELWFETQAVDVNQGIYSVMLGTQTPFPASLDFNSQYYLEVAIDEDGSNTFDPAEIMTPREMLTSIPSAINADMVDGKHASDFGDITGVSAGAGLTGGGASGNVTLSVNPVYVQRRVSSACAVGSSIQAINADGTVVCASHVLDNLSCSTDQVIRWDGSSWQCSDIIPVCNPGDIVDCYSGPPNTLNVGICKPGIKVCDATGKFGPCSGDVLPASEIPYNGIDEDCDGQDVFTGSTTPFPNMFAAKACNAPVGMHIRDTYCPGGTPADFDMVKFKSLYQNLDDTALYPAGSGAYTRQAVPMCENGSDIDVIGGATLCPIDPNDPAPNPVQKEPIRCTDGTRPVFYIRYNPASPNVHNWIMRVQGGDDTCGTHPDETNCYAFKDSHFSSKGTGGAANFGGIFRNVGPFSDWSAIYIDKCVGDRNLGDNRIDDYQYYYSINGKVFNRALIEFPMQNIDAGRGPVYFHGKRILRALLSYLANQGYLQDGSKLLITAQSNGSHGLYQYIDEIALYADAVTGGDVDVRGVPSSYVRSSVQLENYLNTGSWNGFFLDTRINAPESTWYGLNAYNSTYNYYQYGNVTLRSGAGEVTILSNADYLPGGISYERFADWGAVPDKTCTQNATEPWICYDAMHVLMNYMETPIFVAVQTGDKAIRISHHQFADVPASSGACYHPNDFEDRVRAVVGRMDALNAGHGAFVTTTDDHGALSDTVKVARRVGNVPLEQALYDWMMAAPGTESFCVAEKRTGSQSWYHYAAENPGAQACNPAGILP